MIYTYKIQEWHQGEESYTDDTGREVLDVIIGVEKGDGNDRQDIHTFIYKDILEGVNDGIYKYATNPGAEPVIIFKYNGQLIPHNPDMFGLIEDVRGILGDLTFKRKIKALTEVACRKNANESKTMANIAAYVKTATGIPYNRDLIYLVLKEELQKTEDFMNEPREALGNLSKEELIETIGALKEFHIEDSCSNTLLNELIEKFGYDEVYNAVLWEVADRVFFTAVK